MDKDLLLVLDNTLLMAFNCWVEAELSVAVFIICSPIVAVVIADTSAAVLFITFKFKS